MASLMQTIEDIKSNVKQHSASTKDEITVMQEYESTIYKNSGKTETFAPGREFRGMISDIMSSAAKINKVEAEKLVDGYDFRRSQAEVMVGVAKDFIVNYCDTGRKIKLGGREDSNVSLMKKDYPAGMRRYPTRIGTNTDGSAIMGVGEVWVDGYSGIKASSPCPPWISKK